MKLKGLPAYIALAGGAVAIYAFVRSGGYNTAQRDLNRATGGVVPAPTPTPPMTNPATGEPTFGVTNPWANDAIFQPYPYPPSPFGSAGSAAERSAATRSPASGGAVFGVALR